MRRSLIEDPYWRGQNFFMEFFDVVHENRKILYVSGVFHVKFEPKRIKKRGNESKNRQGK